MLPCFLRAFAGVAILSASVIAHAATSVIPLTPERTSVEADFSQVFSARFLNASGLPAVGETVTFSNDACGRFANGGFVAATTTDASGVASMTFTAMQPGGTVCTVYAVAGAQARFQVFTYRLSQVSLVANAPVNLTAGVPFEMPVEARMGAYTLPNVDIGARVFAGTGTANVNPANVNSGSGVPVNFLVTPSGPGDYDVEVNLRTLTKRVAIRFAAAPVPPAAGLHQDLWWSGVAENGWGLSIIEHRDVLFALIFAYDASGRPTWYVIPAGTWSGSSYTGSVYSPRGTPFYAYDASKLAVGTPVGNATLSFTDADHATLDYTINGMTGRKSLSRTPFAPPGVAPLTNRTDMWWGGAPQNGWGIAMIQQNAALFTLWYTYDAAGLPTWYGMPSGSWSTSDTYEGRVYRATGSPWLGQAYDVSRYQAQDAGSYRIRFSGDSATFEYSVEGRSGSLPLTRTPF
jgi:hypothetical protein